MFMQAMMADPLLMGAASQIPLGGAPPAGGIQSEDALSSIPGADIIKKVLEQYGLDSSMLVSIGIIVTIFNSFTGLWQFLLSLLYQLIGVFASYCLSKASIKSSDESFDYVMEYLIRHNISTDSRIFNVDTSQPSVVRKHKAMFYDGATFDDVNRPDSDFVQADEHGPKLKFIPSSSKKKFFWYKMTLFVIEREIDHVSGPSSGGSQRPEDESLDIWTVGRDPSVLRQFLAECRLNYMQQQQNKTIIHTTDMYDMRWSASQSRPIRHLDSVIMTAKDKGKLLTDIQDYLDPKTKAWYLEQGLPYRRGYLLYGLPGTGKTSLSMALAGALNCKLFILSLAAQNLHDNYVQELFMTLPPRSIVLLEDVDSANVDRDYGYGIPDDDVDSDDEEEVDRILNNNRRGNRRPSNVSLSGLLNAIDGIGSHEGRILIMTTNRRESLDSALIRPGRVDMEIEFGKAGREVLEQIFVQLFINKGSSMETKAGEDQGEKSVMEVFDEAAHKEEIFKLADQFANMVPEDMFTPAEVQNYLLPRKRNPQRAIDECPQWLEDQMAELARAEAKERKRRERAILKRRKWQKQRKDLKLFDIDEDEEDKEKKEGDNSEKKKEKKEKKDEENGTENEAVSETKEEEKKDGEAKVDEEKLKVEGETSPDAKPKSVDGDWSDVEASRPQSAAATETAS